MNCGSFAYAQDFGREGNAAQNEIFRCAQGFACEAYARLHLAHPARQRPFAALRISAGGSRSAHAS